MPLPPPECRWKREPGHYRPVAGRGRIVRMTQDDEVYVDLCTICDTVVNGAGQLAGPPPLVEAIGRGRA